MIPWYLFRGQSSRNLSLEKWMQRGVGKKNSMNKIQEKNRCSANNRGNSMVIPFQRKYSYRWASLIAQLVKNPPAMQETLVQFLGWEDPLEKGQATHSSILGLNAGDPGSIPGLGRSPGEGKGYPLQYSGLGNSTYCIVHVVAKSRT